MPDCPYYREAKEDVQIRMSTKDPTKHVYREGVVPWCAHDSSPVNYTRAMTFGGADLLQCGGCQASCQLEKEAGARPLDDWVRGPRPRNS